MTNFGFHVAKVVETATMTDNRLQVKILPYMQDIDDEKCPYFPYFFRDEMYTGNKGDYVWVICDDEFTTGYVFGLANYNTYSDFATNESGESIFNKSVEGINLSIPEDLRSEISNQSSKVMTSSLSLLNTKVDYWDNDCIHYVERSNGGRVIAYRNGTMYVFRPNEMILKIGTCVIKLDSESISMVSPDIKVQGDRVGLGKNPTAKVLINEAGTGMGAIPSSYVEA